jgi:DNA-binding CsgD family transcriptional regulator
MAAPVRLTDVNDGAKRRPPRGSEPYHESPHVADHDTRRTHPVSENSREHEALEPSSDGAVFSDLLKALLGIIEGPAFVVNDAGQILANPMGSSELLRDSRGVRLSLIRIVTGGAEPSWSLAPLRGDACLRGFLAVHLPSPSTAPPTESTSVAKRRWRLTGRQLAVLDLVACGLTNADIGERLGIQQRTVEFHVSSIFDKAGVDNRATLLARLFEMRQAAACAASEDADSIL